MNGTALRCVLVAVVSALGCASGPQPPRSGRAENAGPQSTGTDIRGGDDPLAEVRHERQWAEVTPAPVPSALPLTGPEGRDPDGFPRQTVDRPALRSLLVNRQFRRLTEVLEGFQDRCEANARYEDWLSVAYGVLGYPHPRERELIDAWKAATPDSFAPHLASAAYWEHTGWLWRGERWYRQTTQLERRSMVEAFARAGADARRALALRPRLIEARRVLLAVEVVAGSRERAAQIMEEGLAACPSCTTLRREWLRALQPRWGGSLEEMERYATQRADPGNPRHRALLGLVLLERASEATMAGMKSEAFELIERAAAIGGDADFFLVAADARLERKKKGAARLEEFIADLGRALALAPGLTDALSRRAWALEQQGRWEEAATDLLAVLRSRPTSTLGNELHPDTVRALDALAWKEHQAGRAAAAVRVYDIALALAPGDRDLARRRDVARATAKANVEGAPKPLRGAGLPDLSVVVSANGSPLRDARVIVAPGVGPWTELERLSRLIARSGARTNAAGQVRLQVGPGPWVVVAAAPGEALRATAVAVVVPVTGTQVRVTLSSDGIVRGRVADLDGRPVAGVDVLAIPDTESVGAEPRRIARARSRPDGTFILEGVDGGSYRYLADGEAYGSRMGWIMPRGGADREGRLVLRVQKKLVVKGRVLVRRGGQEPRPAERFEVSALGSTSEYKGEAAGRFSIALLTAPSRQRVSFTVPGFPVVVRELDIAEDCTDVADVVVGEGRMVRGIVVDPDGWPVEGATVSLVVGAPLARSVVDGSFEVSLPEGDVTLRIQHARWLPLERLVARYDKEVEITLSRGAEVKTLVVDAAGSPVSGAPMLLTSGTRSARCTSDETGRCTMAGLEAGLYWLGVGRPPRGDPSTSPPPALRIAVNDATAQGVRIRWSNEQARLRVRVLGSRSGEFQGAAWIFPDAPAVADALDKEGQPKAPCHIVRPGDTVEHLPPNRYRIIAVEGGSAHRRCSSATVELRAGESRETTLQLGEQECR